MGIKQRIKSLVSKRFDGELELRSYPKNGMIKRKNGANYMKKYLQ